MLQNEVVAITVWQGRISPVFDVAAEFLICELSDDGVIQKKTVSPQEGTIYQKMDLLLQHRVTILVCGAISRFAEETMSDHRIVTHSFRAGNTEDLIRALLVGSIEAERFSMPGCICRRKSGPGCSVADTPRRCRKESRHQREDNHKHRRGHRNGQGKKTLEVARS